MANLMQRVLDDGSRHVRSKVAALYTLLLLFNAGAWAWAFIAFHAHPVLLGTALLAYAFGLRHAVDADHIAAIDNVTRKLMQDGKRPVAVGLFFSLGHSTIVVLAVGRHRRDGDRLQGRISRRCKSIGGVVGTLVSASFLLAIALMNILVLIVPSSGRSATSRRGGRMSRTI